MLLAWKAVTVNLENKVDRASLDLATLGSTVGPGAFHRWSAFTESGVVHPARAFAWSCSHVVVTVTSFRESGQRN